MRSTLLALLAALPCPALGAGARLFARRPSARPEGQAVRIDFALSRPADVEVAVLDADGRVVRHLAAGALGADRPPPPPLRPGLAQSLPWDRRDDFGEPAGDGPFAARVRAGLEVELGRMIGANPYAMGSVSSLAADPDGTAYVMSEAHGPGSFKQIVALAPDGAYRRTVLPFPADLPAERLGDFAYWDGRPRPINRNGLGPEFYTTARLTLLPTTDAAGLVLTDGRRLYRLARDGGMAGEAFQVASLWGEKPLPNSGRGPVFLALSPDGRTLYLSGPFSASTMYGHKADPRFPPGQVYRMEMGKPPMEPFVRLPTTGGSGKRPNWVNEHTAHPGHFTVPHGPIHGVAVDPQGVVLVADRDNQCVAAFEPSGRRAGALPLPYPDQLAVHPRTAALYVLTKEIVGYHRYRKALVKFRNWREPQEVARLELSVKGDWPVMALAPGERTSIVWLGGVGGEGGLLRIEDRGEELVVAEDLAARAAGALANADKIAVDEATDEVYINDAWKTFRRFDGLDGSGGEVVRFADGHSATDLAVGPRGYLYAQLGPGYSGPLGRWTRDLEPAPYAQTDTHILSPYIYARYGAGYCEKGIGVGRDGKVYVTWMYDWAKYFVTGFGPDGRPIEGRFLRDQLNPDHYERGTPESLRSGIIGPIPGANGGLRVDSHGNLYVGVGLQPPGHAPPPCLAKDRAYGRLVGSIVKFPPEGGQWLAPEDEEGQEAPPRPRGIAMRGGHYLAGALAVYPGYGPLSGHHPDAGSFGHHGYCVCRLARFDLDRYDRLYIPNAVTNSVRVTDNAGHPIATFGAYGNFDSAGADSPIPQPPIPLGWPVGVGVSDDHVYVADMLNRRVVRVDTTYAAEARCPIPAAGEDER
ncbi:MAG: hypothetical protein ACLF0G_08145 [Candidatus Brocadiia bacterium]